MSFSEFISACHSIKLKQKLLKDREMNIEKCVEIGRNMEISKQQAKEMSNKKIKSRPTGD